MPEIDPEVLRTQELRARVQDELVPFMAEFGFEPSSPPLAGGGVEPFWGDTYSRRREAFSDEIHIEWRSYDRPLFMLEFWTDQTERLTLYDPRLRPASDLIGEYYARILPSTWKGCEIWYGEDMTLAETLTFAKERVTDLDEYLRTGTTTAPLSLCWSVAAGQERPPEVFANPPPPPPKRGLLERLLGRWLAPRGTESLAG